MKGFLFDLTASQPNPDGKYHGGGKYAKKVFFSFLKEVSDKGCLLAMYDSSNSLDKDVLSLLEDHTIKLIDIKNRKITEIVNENAVERIYTALPFNLIKYGLQELYLTKCSIYVTVHGLRTLECPIGYDALKYCTSFKEYIKTGARILLRRKMMSRDFERYKLLFKHTTPIIVSNHTKYAIETLFSKDLGEQNYPVFYSPDVTDFEDAEEEEVSMISVDSKKYFLLISGNRWLKNNIQSALALDQLFSAGFFSDKHVIITGVHSEDVYKNRIKNTSKFHFKKYVSEKELSFLYSNSFAFIYMTLNEGFGYPPLEAMKYGTPTITSPVASVPEVCGDAVLYAAPDSVLEIKNRLLQLRDNEIYQALEEKAVQKYLSVRLKQEEDLSLMVKFLVNK